MKILEKVPGKAGIGRINVRGDFGFSSSMSPDDDRQAAWTAQRQSRGYDNTELWSLDAAFAKYMASILFSKDCLNDARLDLSREAIQLLQGGWCSVDCKDESKVSNGLNILVDVAPTVKITGSSLIRYLAAFLDDRIKGFIQIAPRYVILPIKTRDMKRIRAGLRELRIRDLEELPSYRRNKAIASVKFAIDNLHKFWY